MKRSATTAADYLAQIPDHQRALLELLRATILKARPDVVEGIRYGMLDYPGLANLAAQKNYVALYVMSSVLAAFKSRFPGVNCGKNCLRLARLEQFDEAAVHESLQAVHRARLSSEASSA